MKATGTAQGGALLGRGLNLTESAAAPLASAWSSALRKRKAGRFPRALTGDPGLFHQDPKSHSPGKGNTAVPRGSVSLRTMGRHTHAHTAVGVYFAVLHKILNFFKRN